MKQEDLQLTGGAGKQKRRELDFYPTPEPVTAALMEFLALPAHRIIREPACGDGAMSRVLERYGHTVISTDIRHTGYGEGGIDFLLDSPRHCDVIITNPPFSLSVQFIEKALKEAKVVAMLLKSQYWHAKNKQPLFEKHPPAYVLPLTWRPDFLEHERKPGEKKGAPTMEVAWTVWQKGAAHQTIYHPLNKPKLKAAKEES